MTLEDRIARSAPSMDAAIESYVSGGRRARSHRWMAVAASIVLVAAGAIGTVALRDRSRVTPAPVATDGDLPASTVTEPRSGSALTTGVPADVQAMVIPTLPGWRVDATTGFRPVDVEPSAACPGCGAHRMVLIGDQGVAGPLFTAWSVPFDANLAEFDHPVMVGSAQGRATSSPPGTPLAQTRVTMAWPLTDESGASTAYVDATGVSEQQVLEQAALLSWQAGVPTLSVRPAGVTVVDEPPTSPVELASTFTDGSSVIEFYAVNTGVHGLADWRSLGPLTYWTTEARTVDSIHVALDPPEPADERPILTISATWVVGDWGFVAVGHVFDSEEQFLDAVRSLQLTDPASYSVATADADEYFLSGWVSTTGWNLTSVNPEQPSLDSRPAG